MRELRCFSVFKMTRESRSPSKSRARNVILLILYFGLYIIVYYIIFEPVYLIKWLL